MKPVWQRNRHDPANGVWGDCHRAAIASILELELDEVPHFYDEGRTAPEAEQLEREFLASRGLVPITFTSQSDLDAMLRWIAHYNPGTCHLLGGQSRNGVMHTVICCDGQIVHDPSLDQSGIVGPQPGTEYYWLTFFGSAIATERNHGQAQQAGVVSAREGAPGMDTESPAAEIPPGDGMAGVPASQHVPEPEWPME